MQIRAITYFTDPSYPIDQQSLKLAGEFIKLAQPGFSQGGYIVQSARLATVPFPGLLASAESTALVDLARSLEHDAGRQGYAYISLGPALPDQLESYEQIPAALAATQNAFFAGAMTDQAGRISLPAVRACANVMSRASTISADGFANLRFAALANVPAGSPFFPAAYHIGGGPGFAIATEAADLAVTAFSRANSLEQARRKLVEAIEFHGDKLTALASKIERETGVRFGGIDFSLAPFPEEARSLGNALERLGVAALGRHGSLAAAAFLADTIDRASFPRAGFSGLMLPVLEDAILARRAVQGSLDVRDLLLYSAVCGTGLDTVPLPGDTTTDQLFAILLDLASLSSRLGKPLTARLMPIPGKKAGDPTDFNFPYFASSRVLALDAEPLHGFLAGDETFSLNPRPKR